jgi:hypothetical protein
VSDSEDKVEKLRKHGVILPTAPDPLPKAYQNVVQGLSDPEIDALISAAGKLKNVELPRGPKLVECFIPL